MGGLWTLTCIALIVAKLQTQQGTELFFQMSFGMFTSRVMLNTLHKSFVVLKKGVSCVVLQFLGGLVLCSNEARSHLRGLQTKGGDPFLTGRNRLLRRSTVLPLAFFSFCKSSSVEWNGTGSRHLLNFLVYLNDSVIYNLKL